MDSNRQRLEGWWEFLKRRRSWHTDLYLHRYWLASRIRTEFEILHDEEYYAIKRQFPRLNRQRPKSLYHKLNNKWRRKWERVKLHRLWSDWAPLMTWLD
jgi:hypothetical protein